MAVKKTAGEGKGQDGSARKKAGGTKAASTPKAAAPQAAATKASAPKGAATKKASGKKAAAAPIKLTSTQTDMLTKIGGSGEPGYRSEKKVEQRTLDALQKQQLIKRGAKHKESGSYHYLISNRGKKHLDSSGPGTGTSSGSSAGGTP